MTRLVAARNAGGPAAPRISGNLRTGGPGLPRLSGQIERGPGGVLQARLAMTEYRAANAMLALPELAGKPFELHPVHRQPQAADLRPQRDARWEREAGRVTVPPRTALVYVLP